MKKNLWIIIALIIFGVSCKQKVAVVNQEQTIVEEVEEVIPKRIIDPTALRIAYIGNMGVLIQSQDETVIIDGFHKEYKPEYLFPTEETVMKLINSDYDYFSNINVALTTHNHMDHFDAGYLNEFLKKNPESIAIGSQQVRQAIIGENKEEDDPLDFRIERVPYDNDQYTFFHGEIEVRGVRCDHSNEAMHKSIENIAYLVIVNGYKILHVGDSNWFEGFNGISDFRLREEKLDVAILPYWMLQDPNAVTECRSLLDAKKIIATHIPPNFEVEEIEKIKFTFSNVTLFTELGQEFEL